MNSKSRIPLFLCLLLPVWITFISCTIGPFFRSTECTDTAELAGNAFSSATAAGRDWLYQLQSANPSEIALTDFDILVIDYSKDGTEDGRYTASEMQTLKTQGTARQVIAYLSIGEAEDYRYYFYEDWIALIGGQPSEVAPCWLGRTNPDWKGNYKVQYWSEDWQQVILGYLDKIIADGFDGVYLDIIDAYEYWADDENREGFTIPEETAAARMINFVKRIAYHARVTKGKTDFLVFPQNGEPILQYDTGAAADGGSLGSGDYLSTISGIGIEDLYYSETDQIDPTDTAKRTAYLDTIKNAGKKVIVVDYVDDGSTDQENIDRRSGFRTMALSDGYYPYAALSDRALDSINTFTGQP